MLLTGTLKFYFPQFERRIMLECQREGIARAAAEGKYKGRPVSIDEAKVAEIRQRKADGMGPTEIAKQLQPGRCVT